MRSSIRLLLFGFFILAFVFVHYKAAFSFPVPWSDEAHFLWQSIAVQRTNSLFAPQIEKGRELLMMPPGYMLVLGAIQKLFGFSFSFARALSMLFLILAFAALVAIAQEYEYRTLSLLLIGMFFLSKHFIAAGNVARMEALLILVIAAAYWLMQKNRFYPALGLLAVSPLIHPNGFYFFLAGLGYFFWTNRSRLKDAAPAKIDWLFILLPLILWALYLFHVRSQWQFFLADMAYQFARKGGRDIPALFLTYQNLAIIVVLAAAMIYSARKRMRAAFLLVLAIPAWLAAVIGHEMWYQIYGSIFLMAVGALFLNIVHKLLEERHLLRSRFMKPAAGTLALVLITLLFIRAGMIENPIGYPWNIRWAGMKISKNLSYFNNADAVAIKQWLKSKAHKDRLTAVNFYPAADSLFFSDLENEGFRLSADIIKIARADIYIIHFSRELPEWTLREIKSRFKMAAIDPSSAKNIILRRDNTEVWYGVSRRGAASTTRGG